MPWLALKSNGGIGSDQTFQVHSSLAQQVLCERSMCTFRGGMLFLMTGAIVLVALGTISNFPRYYVHL